MSLKHWVFVLGLLASLRPLSQLLPLLEPWLRQGLSALSQVGQVQQGTQGQADTTGSAVPSPVVTPPQSQPQGGVRPTPGVTTQAVPPQTPEQSTDALQWRPTAEEPLGVILDSKLIVQLVAPLSPAEQAGLNGGDRLLAVNGKPLRSPKELKAVLNHKPQQVVLTVVPLVNESGQTVKNVTIPLSTDATAKL